MSAVMELSLEELEGQHLELLPSRELMTNRSRRRVRKNVAFVAAKNTSVAIAVGGDGGTGGDGGDGGNGGNGGIGIGGPGIGGDGGNGNAGGGDGGAGGAGGSANGGSATATSTANQTVVVAQNNGDVHP